MANRRGDPKDELDNLDMVLIDKFTEVYSKNPELLENLLGVIDGGKKRSKDFYLGYRRALSKAMGFVGPESEGYAALSLVLGCVTFKLSRYDVEKNR